YLPPYRPHLALHAFPTRRSSDLTNNSSRSRNASSFLSQYSVIGTPCTSSITKYGRPPSVAPASKTLAIFSWSISASAWRSASNRSEEHTSELQSLRHLVCRLLLE